MDSGWRPANEVERGMQAALQAGDGRQYAQLLRSVPLYVPVMREGAAPELPGLDVGQVIVFTSPAGLYASLGESVRTHEELDFAALRARHPEDATSLMVNPGLPIGVLLTFGEFDGLAEGSEQLVAMQDVQDAVVDEALADVRQLVLDELGGDEDIARAAVDNKSANELEAELLEAVGKLDFDAFLMALIASDVVVLTTEPVSDPDQIGARGFPWRIVGGDSAVIPVFSSERVLDHLAAGAPDRLGVSFLDVLVNWPGDRYVMCFNPGTSTELTLPGAAVSELVAAIAEAAPGNSGA